MKQDEQSKRIDKILTEYDKSIESVELFQSWFNKKLVSEIKNCQLTPLKIETRIKEKASLEGKLKELRNIHSIKSLEDLVGFRVVFPLEKSAYNFVSHLYKAFGAKHIQYRPRFSEAGYNADHIILKIAPKHARGKNKVFINSKVEIQITSALYYHWTAITHDVLYKDKYNLKTFSPYHYKRLEEKFKKVMVDFIKPATHQLDVLDSSVSRARDGQVSQGKENLLKLKNETELYPLYSGLCTLKASIIDFGDCSQKSMPLINLLEDLVDKLSSGKIAEKNSFGFEPKDILRVILDILGNWSVLWKNPLHVFQISWGLLEHDDEHIAKEAKELILKLCELKLDVIKGVGIQPQQKLLRAIKAIKPVSDKQFIAILEVTGHLGRLEIDASYSDGDNFVIQRGIPTISKELISLRSRALKLFISTLFNAPPRIRTELSPKMHNFFWIAPMVKPNEESLKEIRRCARLTVKLLQQKIEAASLPELILLDKEIAFLQKKDPLVRRQCSKAIEKIKSHTDFSRIMRIIPKREIYYNTEELNKHFDNIASVHPDEIERDVLLISACINTLDAHGQSMIVNSLCQYCERVSEIKPKLKSKLLKIGLDSFWVEYALLLGDIKSGNLAKSKKYLRFWVKRGLNAQRCISLLENEALFDAGVSRKLLKQLISKDDIKNIQSLGSAVFLNLKKPGATQLVLAISSFLDSKNQVMHLSTYKPKWEQAISALPKDVCGNILKTFLHAPFLDNNCDHIIADFGRKFPDELLHLLDLRIEREESSGRRGIKKIYEAIPHDSYWAKEILEGQRAIIIPKIIASVARGSCNEYSASKLLETAWAGDSALLVNSSISKLKGKSRKQKLRVLSFFNFFQDKEAGISFAEAFVKNFNDWNKYKTQLYILTGKQGIVSGEDGFLLAHKDDVAMAENKVKNSSGELQKFWKEFLRIKNQDVALEGRRVERSAAVKEIEYK